LAGRAAWQQRVIICSATKKLLDLGQNDQRGIYAGGILEGNHQPGDADDALLSGPQYRSM
jgi:hypothetical protein